MSAEVWVALAALIFTMFASTITATAVILSKISHNKDQLDVELTAIRMAAYEEYKILRREMSEASDRAYDRFGESLVAIREKVTQVEIWIRDELANTRHTLNGSMDMRYSILEEKIEGIEKSLRELELENARRNGH